MGNWILRISCRWNYSYTAGDRDNCSSPEAHFGKQINLIKINKTKQIAFCLMTGCKSLSFLPLQSLAGIPGSHGLADTKTSTSMEANTLLLRLQEIKEIDKSNLTSSEKKALRKEKYRQSEME
jgi:hypothetical protein